MNEFKKLGIIEPIMKSLEEQGFEEPTEIQRKTIALATQGKDIIAGSATGSGKTLAFGAGMIQNAKRGEGIQGLVLTPTRELAEQVKKSIKLFAKYSQLRVCVVFGGASMNVQVSELRKADIVIATPGRLLDHIGRNSIDLRFVKTVVLDEADRMLDMGFIDDVMEIVNYCPKKRQTLLFSATIHSQVVKISRPIMNNPIEISAEEYVDASKLKQAYYNVRDNQKFSLLVHLLKQDHTSGLVLIFSNTRSNTDFLAKNLKKQGLNVLGIHGGLSQNQRSKAMDMFHAKKASILVCTDVAARGLDIKGVTHVYNYDIPKDAKEYIHRIGRTARAGEDGQVVNILGDRQHENFGKVLENRDLQIDEEPTPNFEKVMTSAPNRNTGYNRPSRSGGRSGGRGYSGRGGGNRGSSRDSRPSGEGRGDRGQGGRSSGGYRGSRSSGEGRSSDRPGSPRPSGGSRFGNRSHGGPRQSGEGRSGNGNQGRSNGGYQGRSNGNFQSEGRSRSQGRSFGRR